MERMMHCFYIWVALQIIAESFPISSSGHTALLAHYCSFSNILGEFGSLFSYIDYALHLPTALLVALFFAPKWMVPFFHIKRCWRLIAKIAGLTFLSATITVAGYGIASCFSSQGIYLGCGFAFTFLSLLSLRWCPEGVAHWDVSKAILLGLVQLFAFIPGVSRLAFTFVAARWLGISSRRSFEISFLIQWPLILAASVYGSFVLQNVRFELLNETFLLVILGASMLAYAGMYVVAYMVQKKCMWWWSMYVLLPLVISYIAGVVHV